ncbi:CatB-related O-acetyltransferase [Rickettsiales endosymbiont of Stachyamoeba lipophora]|uniref:CatB-related O-acetyltransferase n=1 Tax=Rickettsiales endosymbiont of Stachyamoeba lipophora TaxID=2486578 RepID=UPI000F655C94|nr:CatB-related O-acetyltransferase [Rickettsiales endosymbiont of Stachyamoeba lipophora]AZL15940.1 antibiotic acetyltransferase [Rickettsiales endosymbiont of Stachyamoeba lipophora]
MNPFNSYRESIIIKDHIKCEHIIVGDYTYYSGYYHGKPFEDCVMYLDEKDNHFQDYEIDKLIIGKFCSIATGVKFMMGGTQGHNYNWIAAYPLDGFDDDFDVYTNVPPKAHKLKGDTVIGNDVWIGAEAMIMPGIKIADGAVIGARSLITKNVGPYEIWGGNPARFIKKRFESEDIEKLLQIKWCDWDIATLKRNLDLLRSDKVAELHQKFVEGKL